MISDFRFSSPLRRSFRACRSSCSGSGALSISSHTNVAAASTDRRIARISVRSVIVGANKGFPRGGDGGMYWNRGDGSVYGDGDGIFRRMSRDGRMPLLYGFRSWKAIFAICRRQRAWQSCRGNQILFCVHLALNISPTPSHCLIASHNLLPNIAITLLVSGVGLVCCLPTHQLSLVHRGAQDSR